MRKIGKWGASEAETTDGDIGIMERRKRMNLKAKRMKK